MAARAQVKFKCTMFREASDRFERVRQRRLEEERQAALEAEAQERRHVIEMERLALEIQAKKQLAEHCRHVAGGSARREKRNFRHRAAEHAVALEKQIEAQVKGNTDLDLHLKHLKVMRRWLNVTLDSVFDTWAGRAGVARTSADLRTLQTAADHATSRANTLFAEFEAGHLPHQLSLHRLPPTAAAADDTAKARNGTNQGEGAKKAPGERQRLSRGQRWRASQQRHLWAEASGETDEAEEGWGGTYEWELQRRSLHQDFIDSCAHPLLTPEGPPASWQAGDSGDQKDEDHSRVPCRAESRGWGQELPPDPASHEVARGGRQRPVTSLPPRLRSPGERKNLGETNRQLKDRVMQLEGEVLRLEVAALQQAPPVRCPLQLCALFGGRAGREGGGEGGREGGLFA